ncbi:MAG TPA: cupin domain-containing protein [Kiritimatiellia bacterium]|nr:cupin domain-containing protein [Kiritimatiellia bacterium]
MKANEIIEILGLTAHPEGGYFKETYRASIKIPANALPAGYQGDRDSGTSIYFLITSESFSAFHRTRSAEMWNFHHGNPIRLFMIHADGRREEVVVGMDLHAGQQPQFLVPAETWFAATVEGEGFSLAGCSVSPGFDFKDFELADRKTLTAQFPAHEELIHALTRESA